MLPTKAGPSALAFNPALAEAEQEILWPKVWCKAIWLKVFWLWHNSLGKYRTSCLDKISLFLRQLAVFLFNKCTNINFLYDALKKMKGTTEEAKKRAKAAWEKFTETEDKCRSVLLNARKNLRLVNERAEVVVLDISLLRRPRKLSSGWSRSFWRPRRKLPMQLHFVGPPPRRYDRV